MNYETARTKRLIELYLISKFPKLPLELGAVLLSAFLLGGYYVFMFWGYRG